MMSCWTPPRGGTLTEPGVLAQQVQRMLTAPRASRFIEDFVEQWLQVRNLHAHEPDRRIFRGFDPTLRDAMVRETQLFFESQVREDRPIQELLHADYTFLNESLARHYGIDDIYGSPSSTGADDRRSGLLGQGSVLRSPLASATIPARWIGRRTRSPSSKGPLRSKPDVSGATISGRPIQMVRSGAAPSATRAIRPPSSWRVIRKRAGNATWARIIRNSRFTTSRNTACSSTRSEHR